MNSGKADAITASATANEMDEQEIDAWYEEEKEKCLEKYMSDVASLKSYEKAEGKYHEMLGRLMEKYNKMMLEKVGGKESGRLKGILERIKGAKISLRKNE